MPDKFPNTAFLQATETAANTLTYAQLSTLVSTFEKKAMLIHAVQWYWSDFGVLAAADDYLQVAITGSNKMTGLALDDPAVFVLFEWHSVLDGTPASQIYYQTPIWQNFGDLPGGGLLVPANPLYMAIEGVSLAAAESASARMLYTIVDLKTDEYWELVEAIRFIE